MMLKLSGIIIGVVAGLLLVAPSPSVAVMKVEYNYVCYGGYADGNYQETCYWVPYYYDDGAGGGYEEPGDDVGAGGGGGGSTGGETTELSGVEIEDGLTVTADGKHVHSTRTSCSSEPEVRRAEVQRAVLSVQPFFPRGGQVELEMSTGETQSFKRISTTGALQFFQTTSCE